MVRIFKIFLEICVGVFFSVLPVSVKFEMCSHNSFQCGICCFLTENKKKSSTKTEPREESNQTRKLNQEGNGTQGTATFTINIRRHHSRRRTLFHCSVWLLYFCFLISSQQQSSNKVSSCSICTCTHFFRTAPADGSHSIGFFLALAFEKN